MKAGRLDRKIQILEAQRAQDSHGGDSSSWSVIYDLPAGLIKQKGEEFFSSGKDTPQRRVIFRIRYRSGINEAMRVRYEGDDLKIIEIKEIGRRQGLDLRVESING